MKHQTILSGGPRTSSASMARPPSIFFTFKGGQAQGPPPKYAPGCSPISTRRLSPSLCAKTTFCDDVFILRCTYSCRQSFCEFFSVANSFLSLNQMKITSFSNCFEQLSLSRQFALISSLADFSLNTLNQDRGEK